MRATAVLDRRPHMRWAAPGDRKQDRAGSLQPAAVTLRDLLAFLIRLAGFGFLQELQRVHCHRRVARLQFVRAPAGPRVYFQPARTGRFRPDQPPAPPPAPYVPHEPVLPVQRERNASSSELRLVLVESRKDPPRKLAPLEGPRALACAPALPCRAKPRRTSPSLACLAESLPYLAKPRPTMPSRDLLLFAARHPAASRRRSASHAMRWPPTSSTTMRTWPARSPKA